MSDHRNTQSSVTGTKSDIYVTLRSPLVCANAEPHTRKLQEHMIYECYVHVLVSTYCLISTSGNQIAVMRTTFCGNADI